MDWNSSENLYIKPLKDSSLTESGLERLKRMYSSNECGFLSPELHFVMKTGTTTVICAGIFGGLINMLQAKDDFLRKNVASRYESQHLARRSLTDTMTLSGIKGAVKSGIRYGSFSTLYVLGTTTAANYNNKITVWEHAVTGAILGGIARLNYGLKGISVAACLGGVLGLLAGGIIVTSLWCTGSTIEDLRQLQYEHYYNFSIKNRKMTS